MRRTRIAGVGHYVPERVVTNQDLEQLMDTSDAWIQERTGIRERRFTEPGTGSTALGTAAARAALESAGWEPEDVQFIIFATLSPDFYFPGNGVLLQRALEVPGIGAMVVPYRRWPDAGPVFHDMIRLASKLAASFACSSGSPPESVMPPPVAR